MAYAWRCGDRVRWRVRAGEREDGEQREQAGKHGSSLDVSGRLPQASFPLRLLVLLFGRELRATKRGNGCGIGTAGEAGRRASVRSVLAMDGRH